MTTPAFTFGSLASGIEAASEAFLPLGGQCAYVSEIEPYPCAVLAQRHGAGRPLRMPAPDEASDPAARRDRLNAIKAVERYGGWGQRLTNYGDLTQIEPYELPFVDILVAGLPCQDFSIAGLRQSLAGARGNLTLYFVKLIHELVRLRRIRSVLYENVPDILNTKDNAFGAFLGGLVGHDAPIVSPLKRGRWTNAGVADGPLGTVAWRVLDAQYAGVAQRRERLFLVASFGDGPDPVEVLFERQGLSRDPPARGQAGEGIARPLAAGSAGSGGYRLDADTAENLIPTAAVAPALRARHNTSQRLGSEAYVACAPHAFGGNRTGGELDIHTALTAVHTASGRQDFETETFIVQDTVATLDASFGRLQGASGQDANHGHSHLVVGAVTHALTGEGVDASEDGTGRGTPIVPVAYVNAGHFGDLRESDVGDPLRATGGDTGNGGETLVAFNARQDPISDYICQPLDTDGDTQAIAFSAKDYGGDAGELSPTLRSMGHAASHPNGGGQVAVASSLRGREGGTMPEVEADGLAPALRAAEGGSTRPFVAFQSSQSGVRDTELAPTLDANMGSRRRNGVIDPEMAVRRITCVEAERLQGFADNYTLIDWPSGARSAADLAETVAYLVGHGFSEAQAAQLAQTPDGPRYKAIGNSKAVPLVRLIGERYAAALGRHLTAQEAA